MLRRPARRAVHKSENTPKQFGDLVNADHIIANSEEAMGLTGERNALAIVDRFSDYKDCFPLATKDADDACGALLEFFGRSRPKYMWTDSAPELIRAISDMKVPKLRLHATKTTGTANAWSVRLLKVREQSSSMLVCQAAFGPLQYVIGVSWTTLQSRTVTRHGIYAITRGSLRVR